MTNVSVNVARAAGPALAGVVIALGRGRRAVLGADRGPCRCRRHPRGVRAARHGTGVGRSAIGAAVRAGARYLRFSAPLRVVIGRTAAFVLFGERAVGDAPGRHRPEPRPRRVGVRAADGRASAAAPWRAPGAAAVSDGARLQRPHARRAASSSPAWLRRSPSSRRRCVAAAVLVVVGVAWIGRRDKPVDRRSDGRAGRGFARTRARRLAAGLPARLRRRRRAVGPRRERVTRRCAAHPRDRRSSRPSRSV